MTFKWKEWRLLSESTEGSGGAPAATGTEVPAATTTAEAPVAPAKEKPWYDVRIAQLTAKSKALEEQLAAKTAAQPAAVEGAAKPAPTEIDVETRAAAIAAERVFNETCNAIYETGKGEFKDFDSKIDNFKKLGGIPPGLIEASIEAGAPHKILHYLGENMDEAAKVLSMPPLKMAVAVIKLAAKLNKTPALSNVDEPIKPLSGRSTGPQSGVAPEDMPLEDWMKWREKNVAERVK